jgi:hypothetical protein
MTFEIIAAALKTLPHDRLLLEFESARGIARPTWRQMGFIDRKGRGQTQAGHRAGLMIAAAIVDAFAAELQAK